MTSDESAKPHPALQDRNSFDISRRSEEDVAAEIAARLSAWKQARGRGNASPAPAARPAAGSAMVRPGATQQRSSDELLGRPQPYGQSPMPRFGEYAEERPAAERAPDPVAPAAPNPSALRRAVPAAPSLSRATRAFPFRAGAPRPAALHPEEALPAEEALPESFADLRAAGIEMPHVDRAAAEIPEREQISVARRADDPRVDPGDEPSVDDASAGHASVNDTVADPVAEPPQMPRAARPASICSPVIETWEDEEAAIAAAAIPRLAIPERVMVPMAGRDAARGGTGWAMSLGAILLFLGVTLPAALWQQPQTPDEASTIASVPESTPPEVNATRVSAARVKRHQSRRWRPRHSRRKYRRKYRRPQWQRPQTYQVRLLSHPCKRRPARSWNRRCSTLRRRTVRYAARKARRRSRRCRSTRRPPPVRRCHAPARLPALMSPAPRSRRSRSRSCRVSAPRMC